MQLPRTLLPGGLTRCRTMVTSDTRKMSKCDAASMQTKPIDLSQARPGQVKLSHTQVGTLPSLGTLSHVIASPRLCSHLSFPFPLHSSSLSLDIHGYLLAATSALLLLQLHCNPIVLHSPTVHFPAARFTVISKLLFPTPPLAPRFDFPGNDLSYHGFGICRRIFRPRAASVGSIFLCAVQLGTSNHQLP